MFKKMVVFLACCVSFHMYAMEKECQDICLLSTLPSDVQDLIASYLMAYDEEEKEFAERTEHHNYQTRSFRSKDNNLRYACMIYAPNIDQKMYVGYRSSNEEVKVMILDEMREKKITITYGNDLPECFALSPQGTFLAAAIERKYTEIPECWMRYLKEIEVDNFGRRYYCFNVIKIINMVTNQTRTFPVLIKSLYALAYNKQGNELIVHGEMLQPSDKEYKIFPLKQLIAGVPESDKNKKSLNYYLREKRVCKSISNCSIQEIK